MLSGFWRRPCPVPLLFPGRRVGRGVKSPKCPPLPCEGGRKGDYGQRRSPPGVQHGAQPPRPGDGSVSGVREPGGLLSTVPSHVLGKSADRACGQEPPGAACGRRGGPGLGRDTCVCLPFAAPSCGAGVGPSPPGVSVSPSVEWGFAHLARWVCSVVATCESELRSPPSLKSAADFQNFVEKTDLKRPASKCFHAGLHVKRITFWKNRGA